MQKAFFALGLALVASGCTGQADVLRKEVDALRQEVGRVHAMNETLTARVETLELSRVAQQSAPAASKNVPRDDDRPLLDVVRLKPTSDATSEPTNVPAEIQDLDVKRPLFRSTSGGVVVAQDVGQGDTKNVQNMGMKQAARPLAGASVKGTAR